MKVGDKVKGIEFPRWKYPHWNELMSAWIDQEGEIIKIFKDLNIVTVDFGQGVTWNYPIDELLKQLES